MIDPAAIRKDMPVIGSDGETLGQVDGVEGVGGADGDARIKLKRTTSPDGQHHHVPFRDVARVDEHVHLSRPAREVRDGWMIAGGAGENGAAAGAGALDDGHADGHKSWLPWILGALALFALLVFALRSCDNVEPAGSAGRNEVAASPPAPPAAIMVAEQTLALPGGATVVLAPGTIGYDLQRFLASNEAAPRRFAFERLNFDTASADLRAIDRPTVDGLARILVAYPAARVRLVGYADARGDTTPNVDLGADRARAVAAALIAAGVAADRVETATGGEAGAVAPNATAQGQAENRRTELIVLVK